MFIYERLLTKTSSVEEEFTPGKINFGQGTLGFLLGDAKYAKE